MRPVQLGAAALAAVLAVIAASAEPRAIVVSERTRGIRVADGAGDAATLVVLVVDDAGDPVDEVPIRVLAGARELAAGVSDGRGRAIFRVARSGPVTVTAAEEGFVPVSAQGVLLRRGGLTCVALPLEQEAPAPAAQPRP